MKKSVTEEILADFRKPNGDIDLDGYLGARGFCSFLSMSRDFTYDNDATDTCIVLFISNGPNLSSTIKTNHTLSYENFHSNGKFYRVLLKYWPDQLAQEELSDLDNYGKFCTEDKAITGLFHVPIGAIDRIVELAEQYGAKA